MVGMDVDQTRQLAAALTRQAGRLHEIGATLDGLVRQMRWDGPDAEQLRSVWSSSARRQLADAGAALHDAGALLQREAEAQEQASGGSGGATDGVAGGVAGTLRTGLGGGAGASWFAPGDAVLHRFTGALDASGYSTLAAAIGFGTSPLITGNRLMDAIDRNPVWKRFDRFNKGLSVVTSGADLYRAFGPGSHADAGDKIGAVGGTAATALKMTKNPVLYLAGVATASVTEAAVAATEVDWSAEGRRQVWDAVTQDPGMVLNELGKASTQVVTDKIWKVLG